MSAGAILVLLILGVVSPSVAEAKGPVNIKICGERDCVKKKSPPRLVAALLYGGRSHEAPTCAARVHTAIVHLPGPFPRTERYLIANPRGLIGRQGKDGYVWWRKVKGWKKSLIAKTSRPTGKGFVAGPDLSLSALFEKSSKADTYPWRLRAGLITCSSSTVSDQGLN